MTQTRHAPSSSKSAMVLEINHAAVVEGRSLFRKSANEHKRHSARILVSGFNSRKIGKKVIKGKWAGFPIFTFTLEERKTCPRSCTMYQGCYGNRMPWALRYQPGKETENRIENELSELQVSHPKGFVVRLHVLGDFYSVHYVNKWEKWLNKFPALHVYGYTSRTDEIGLAVEKLATNNWERFAVRTSANLKLPATAVQMNGQTINGIVCPAETGKTDCCGSCALCWAAPEKTIVFLEH